MFTKNSPAVAGAIPHTVPFTGPREIQEAFVDMDQARGSPSGSVPLKSRMYRRELCTESETIGFEIVGPTLPTVKVELTEANPPNPSLAVTFTKNVNRAPGATPQI